MKLTQKASALSLVSIMLVAGAVFLGNQRQAFAEEASLGEQIVCDVFTQLGTLALPPGSLPCEAGSGGGVVIPPPPSAPQCADGIDNDGDGLIDFVPVLGDPGCSDIHDNTESSNSCPGQHWNGSQCGPKEETDVCPNIAGAQATVPEGYVLSNGLCTPIVAPVDVCPNIDGVQEAIPEGKVLVDGNCVDVTSGGGGYAQASYGGSSSYSQAAYGGGGNGPIAGAGFTYPAATSIVLGAASSTVSTESCDQYLTAFIKPNGVNDEEQVKRLQVFLNEFEGANLTVNGMYDARTLAAVHAFQTANAETILMPWGIKKSTGYVFLTTRKAVNEKRCARLQVAFPLTAEEQTIISKNRAITPKTKAAPVSTPEAVPPKKPVVKDMKGEALQKPATTTSPVKKSWSPVGNFLRSLFKVGN